MGPFGFSPMKKSTKRQKKPAAGSLKVPASLRQSKKLRTALKRLSVSREDLLAAIHAEMRTWERELRAKEPRAKK